MLKLLALSTLFLAAGCASSTPSKTDAPIGPLRLRVASYNVHHGAGVDGRIDLPRIAAVINALKPDLVALQEVDDTTQRSGGVDQAAELGKLTGMTSKFARAIDLQGGHYGQAILSRFPIADLKIEELQSAFDAEQRIAAIATIKATKDHPAIVFASTHLDHKEETARVPQARQLASVLGQDTGSLVILAGDFNATPGSPTMSVFNSWHSITADDAMSYPAEKPEKKIDWILTPRTQPWTVVEARVVEEKVASDHRPVVVELERAR